MAHATPRDLFVAPAGTLHRPTLDEGTKTEAVRLITVRAYHFVLFQRVPNSDLASDLLHFSRRLPRARSYLTFSWSPVVIKC